MEQLQKFRTRPGPWTFESHLPIFRSIIGHQIPSFVNELRSIRSNRIGEFIVYSSLLGMIIIEIFDLGCKENFVNCEKSSEINFNWNDERSTDLELFKENERRELILVFNKCVNWWELSMRIINRWSFLLGI